MLGNSLPQKFDVRDKEIVTDQLNLFTKLGGQLSPALPIIFGAPVLNRNDWKARTKIGIVIN